MPIGCCSLVAPIVSELHLLRPASVLDLGIGMGFYGAVVRQWNDYGFGRHTRLVGVEGFAGYRNPCWDLYDEVLVMPIEEYLEQSTDAWDAILLLDVLEHLSRERGDRLLQRCLERLTDRGRFFVGTPAVWMEQGAANGNELERHRSLWTASDFESRGYKIVLNGQCDAYGNWMVLAVGERGAGK